MRRYATGLSLCVLLLAASLGVATQSAQLSVASAGPEGEIGQLQDANEVRVQFSEPMVALGRVPSNPTPPWIHLTPAIKGTFRWSGTTLLIFTPDPNTPLPNATRYTVTVDGSAVSDAGRKLGAPYHFAFTTPTLRLTSARWYRRDDRFDRPAVLILHFNQRVKPSDIAGHIVVRYQGHPLDTTSLPSITGAERARLQATDPDGLRKLDEKVALARTTAGRTDAIAARVTTDWDVKRFPKSDTMAVLETTSAPAPGGFLQITLDTSAIGVEGREHPPQAQQSTVELDPIFFLHGPTCRAECTPDGYNRLLFTVPVKTDVFAKTLTVRDITNPARDATITPNAAATSTPLDAVRGLGLEDAGFANQPPATTFAYRVDPSLTSADGQTLGYPAIAIVENWHRSAFTSFGDGHGVWETSGGRLLPFYARNYRNATQWLVTLSPQELMPRILALEKNGFQTLPPGAGTSRRLNLTIDATQSHGFDLSSALGSGPGIVWAGLSPADPIPQAKVSPHEDSSTIVQVTNLGINVKDSPQGALVFVTRLDTGDVVPDAHIAIVNTANQELWRGTTNRDGLAMSPALPLRDPDDWYPLSFIVTAEKDGDVAYVASNWNEGISPWEFDSRFDLFEANDVLRGSIFTDRGVYKPGEEIHVKAILRADTPTGIRLLPAGQPLDVTITDARGARVDTRSVTVNRWSSAEWTWTVPAAGTLGNYQIALAMPSPAKPARNDAQISSRTEAEQRADYRAERVSGLRSVGGSFLVAAYRKPDFRVDTTLTAEPPIAGASLHGAVDARYLFGSAMTKRPVTWTVTKSASWGVPDAITTSFPAETYAVGYYSADTRPTGRVDGNTSALGTNGTFATDVKTTTGVDYPIVYTFEGDVEDVSRQHIANSSSVVVHPAPWYIAMRRPDYFADTAKGTSTDLVAVDLKGTAVAGVPITLALVHVQWNSVQHSEGHGFYSWESERVENTVKSWTVTSAATPVHVEVPIAEGGYYELRATAKDAQGHATRTDTDFYGIGKGYTAWERYDHNRITLKPERTTWKPGETARVMIQSPWETATALLTVEREGVRHYTRFQLTSTQQTVEVPIAENDIPNVYVSVLLVRGRTSNDPGADGADPGKPSFRLGYTELQVVDDVETPESGRQRGSPGVPSRDVREGLGRRARSRWQTRGRRGHALGRRLRRALAHELPGAERDRRRLPAQGTRGAQRRQPRAHDQPSRADAEGGWRRRRRRQRSRRARRAQGFPAARVLARLGRNGRIGHGDERRHAARSAHDVPHHGGRRRLIVALRIGVGGDQGQQAGDAARRVPALHGAGRSRVVRRRRHQHAADGRRGDDHDQEPRPVAARVPGHRVAIGAARRGVDRADPLRRDRARHRHGARADDRRARQRDRRVRDDAADQRAGTARDQRRVRRRHRRTRHRAPRAAGRHRARARRPPRESFVDGARRPRRRRALPRRLRLLVRRAEVVEPARAGACGRPRHGVRHGPASRRPTTAHARRSSSPSCRTIAAPTAASTTGAAAACTATRTSRRTCCMR